MHARFRLLSLTLVGLLAACSDHSPYAPGASLGRSASTVQMLNCVAAVQSHTVSCTAASNSPAANLSSNNALRHDLIVGGQGTYVQLTSSNVNYNSGTQAFSFDVTVQNLLAQAMATSDGTTADPNGVRVFFSTAPVATSLSNSGGPSAISIANGDGVGTFTAAGQAYYQYSGVALGGDGILSPNETSSSKTWIFTVDPNVLTFSFVLYVSASVPSPNGYVDVTPSAPFILNGSTQALTGVSRTPVGNVASGTTITWSTSDAAVATVDANSGLVTGVAPGLATITANDGTRIGSTTISVCPNLAVGDIYTVAGTAAATTCLAGGNGSQAEYVAVPYNSDRANSVALTATATGIAAVVGPPTPNLIAGPSVLRRSLNTTALLGRGQSKALELTIRLQQLRAVPSLQGRGSQLRSRLNTKSLGIRSIILQDSVPVPGDMMSLDVAEGCVGTSDLRTGTVVKVSQHAIIVVDNSNPSGGFGSPQYDSIAAQFDTVAYPVDSANFGAPTDGDHNGHIVLFFTSAVNALSPNGSSAYMPAVFTTRDVFPSDGLPGDCPLSNQGEIIYMAVPDPTGAINNNPRSDSLVMANAGPGMAHQLQHLINSWRRAYVTAADSFENVWLDEGLSSVAEELAFYKVSGGLGPRQAIDLATVTSGVDRTNFFVSYAGPDFLNYKSWLQHPDTTSEFRDPGSDGTPTLINMGARGELWAFLRYAADRVNGTDQTFWYNLVNSNLQGEANIQNAIGGASVDTWFRDFAVAAYTSDTGLGVASQYTTPSWNYRSIYVSDGGLPLLTTPLTNGVGSSVTLATGANAYLRFGVTSNGFGTLGVTTGGSLPSTFSMVIVRTK